MSTKAMYFIMKKLRYLLIITALLTTCIEIQGQFLKNLKKDIEDKVEKGVSDAVSDKVANEAEKKTEQMLDELFSMQLQNNSPVPIGGTMVDAKELPEKYYFEWIYTLEMETPESKEKLLIDYYLMKDAGYFGATFKKAGDMFMVYDYSKDLTAIYSSKNGNKSVFAMKNAAYMDSSVVKESMDEDYTMKEISGKTILGYKCKGYEITTDEHVITMYVTFEPDISFGDVMGKDQNMPDQIRKEWIKNGEKEGLVMEMDMVGKTEDDTSMKMTCKDLKKQKLTIAKSDYTTK
ncbi:DUF4412 domain-containing protein [Mangrovivirga sp. M17]|uniref:DUF4412 domain-containing protein n=1 Tax=Mangrovivirga halotolerans TaxID=2993936 RepID=A0ABT3RN37_9BACT|nr:DUF4412 domain-containing protein [Mangrovivirga halotolerans]MCX2743228.1 DUF4412 domain-containing protein [Mangrovivirga halotolerans]